MKFTTCLHYTNVHDKGHLLYSLMELFTTQPQAGFKLISNTRQRLVYIL